MICCGTGGWSATSHLNQEIRMNFTPNYKMMRVCFCGPDCHPLPNEPLTAHHTDCLVWDWALSQGMISPALRLSQLIKLHALAGMGEDEGQ
jgi:hypothetical protein